MNAVLPITDSRGGVARGAHIWPHGVHARGVTGVHWDGGIAQGDEDAQADRQKGRQDEAAGVQASAWRDDRHGDLPVVVQRARVAGAAGPLGANICTVRCPALYVLMGVSVLDLRPAEPRPGAFPHNPALRR